LSLREGSPVGFRYKTKNPVSEETGFLKRLEALAE